jgi:hypothetical protein
VTRLDSRVAYYRHMCVLSKSNQTSLRQLTDVLYNVSNSLTPSTMQSLASMADCAALARTA